MRHHGTIKEDRRGLAAIAGLLCGIFIGAAMLAGPTDVPAQRGGGAEAPVVELARR